MPDLSDLIDDELLLVLPYLRVWDLLNLKNSGKRFSVLVTSYLKLQKRIDFRMPFPSKQDTVEMLKGLRKLILDTIGPNLVELSVDDSYEGRQLLENEDFVTELARRCPKLGRLPIVNPCMLLSYCKLNGKSLKHLRLVIESNDQASNEARKEVLELCVNVKKLDIWLEDSRSISWIRDVLASRTNLVESLTISYGFLTQELSEEIQSIVKTSSRLNEINLTVRQPATQLNSVDVQRNASLAGMLPQLNEFQFVSFTPSLDALEHTVTRLEVAIMDIDFRLDFLESFEKLTELHIIQHCCIEVFSQLVERLPESVTSFKTNCVNHVQLLALKQLLRQRGHQFSRFEVTFTDETSEARDLLLEVANNCPSLENLVFEGHILVESSNWDCSHEFELITSRLTKIRTINISGLFVSQRAFESCLAHCHHLKTIQVSLSGSTYDRTNSLKKVLDIHPSIYQATVNTTENFTAKRNTVYQYLNGIMVED
ncbi:hypothetical protein HDE_00961 [Halotydeus destructor]|nr:hypothetical protein HDE_00961 [Halotydeus destructor]